MKRRDEEPSEDQPRPGRTERRRASKRAADDAVELVQRLVALRPDQLEAMDLHADLRRQLLTLHPMKPTGARRRLHRHIAGQLRGEDTSDLVAQLAHLNAGHEARVEAEHALEGWRGRLLRDGDAAIEALVAVQPHTDRQRIRQLVRQAHKDAAQGRPPRASRQLFRLLRELFEEAADDA